MFLLLLIICAFFIVVVGNLNSFGVDEIEHVHSAWLISIGEKPYIDFFQHHNPIFWFTLIPLFWIFGQTTATLFAAKTLTALIAAISLIGIYLCAKEMTKEKRIALLSVLLFATCAVFPQMVDIRPDGLQSMLCIFSLYFLMRYLNKSKKQRDIIIFGVLLGLAFLVLQKTLPLVGILGIFTIIQIYKDRKCILPHALMWAGFVAVIIIGAMWVIFYNDPLTYWMNCWILNKSAGINFAIGKSTMLKLGILFALGAIWAYIAARIPKSVSKIDFILFGILAANLIGLFFVTYANPQYFLLIAFILSIYSAKAIFELIKHRHAKIILTLVVLCIAGVFLFTVSSFSHNPKQLDMINYVLDNSKSTDLVYDGDLQFNLYRKDVHYFWYSLRDTGMFNKYNIVTGGRFSDYNICSIINEKKPKFILTALPEMKQCNISGYAQTGFDNLMIRKE